MSDINREIRNINLVSAEEKDQVLQDAISKVIDNVSMEYNLTYAQIIGNLEVVKDDFLLRMNER